MGGCRLLRLKMTLESHREEFPDLIDKIANQKLTRLWHAALVSKPNQTTVNSIPSARARRIRVDLLTGKLQSK